MALAGARPPAVLTTGEPRYRRGKQSYVLSEGGGLLDWRSVLGGQGLYGHEVVPVDGAYVPVQSKLVVGAVGAEGTAVRALSRVGGQVVLQALAAVAARDELAAHCADQDLTLTPNTLPAVNPAL